MISLHIKLNPDYCRWGHVFSKYYKYNHQTVYSLLFCRMMDKMLKRIRYRAKFIFDLLTNDNIRTGILHAIPFWIASLLVGLVAVLYTRMFRLSENILKEILTWHHWMI